MSSPQMTRIFGLLSPAGFCCACTPQTEARPSAARRTMIPLFMADSPFRRVSTLFVTFHNLRWHLLGAESVIQFELRDVARIAHVAGIAKGSAEHRGDKHRADSVYQAALVAPGTRT